MNQTDGRLLFTESQRFKQASWLPLIAVMEGLLVMVISVIMFERPTDHPPDGSFLWSLGLMVVWVLVLTLPVALGAMWLIKSFRLTTEVRTSGLYIRLFPYQLSFHRIELDDLVEIRVRTYRALAEFGGYGRKFGWKGSCYTISGEWGVDLKFAGRRPLLIGSQMPQKLADALGLISAGRRVDSAVSKEPW